MQTNREVSAEKLLSKIPDEYSDVLKGNQCFKGTFSIQVKDDAKPYQMSLRHVAYALQVPFREE